MLFLPRLLAGTLVVAVFALVVADVHENFALLGTTLAWVLIAAATLILVLAHKRLNSSGKTIATMLVTGAAMALALGILGYGSVLNRTVVEWKAAQDRAAERIAIRATTRFASLCRNARERARQLARASPIAIAVEGSDAQDYLSGAFDALACSPLPSAHPRGAPGATLYDALRRPLAWSGDNVSLSEVLDQFDRVPESGLFVIEQGVYTYLVAIEPLLSRRGFVSVEIPLIADRRLQNRYLEDYDAVSSWLDRSTETEFRMFGDDASELPSLAEAEGDVFWGGTEDASRLYFALRSDSGELFGMSSVAGEAPAVARLDARRRYKLAAATALVLSALAALFWLVRSVPNTLPRLVAIWGARFVVFFTDFPLSLGLDADNPTYYASSLFFGLARSPIDFLLTATALLTSALIIANACANACANSSANAVGKRKLPGRFTLAYTSLASGAVLAVLIATDEVIHDAWLNSSLALSTISIFPFDAPRFALQLGLVMLFLASVTISVVIIGLVRDAGPARAIAIDVAVFSIGYFVAREFGLTDHVLLALPSFAVVRVFSLRQSILDKRRRSSGLYVRLSTAGLLIVSAVVSFYPAIARFEDTTVQDLIETTVAPIVLELGSSRLYAVAETARAIDRMEADGLLDALDREDLAFQIWVETDLVALSLSSSIEIVDDASRIVSRFTLSLPTAAVDPAKAPAPDEWILEEESIDDDPKHPGVLLARRAILGPDDTTWEIRVRLAADWRNLPFISTTNPYLYLFSTAGVDAPFRFPYRELSLFVLEPDGSPVFQSTGAALQLAEQIVNEARRAPVWWAYSRGGQNHEAYLFHDGTHTFVLSYLKTGAVPYAAELAAWAVLAAGLTLFALAVALVLGAAGSERGVSPRELWAGVGTSFHGKLYVAFVLIALVPIASLAFLIRGIVIQQLERDIEQEGMARAQVVERFVNDFLRYRRITAEGPGDRAVNDAVLEWVGSLAGVDVDLYTSGELVATSKPELFGSGLLRSRAAPTAYRDLVLERLTHSIHRESVGSFEYLVVSVPISIERRQEPGILALPLASQKTEIDLRVSSMNQTLLLTAFCFSLAAAALAYSLARRIAEPINTLTDATHRVAEGDLDVSLETASKDEIGALFASFTQMAADLKRQRSDLERTKKLEAWAEMAHQVAHEVKNPLTPIQLAAEHLLRVHDDPNVDFEKVLDECTETILQQVKALRQISMEFSTFASPEPLKPEPTDIGALVRETVAPYVQAPPAGVSVSVDIADDLPPLRADARLLKRTLLNLVENALHAVNGEGSVDVKAIHKSSNGASFVEVAVADTGVGIEPELKKRIFEPYFSTRAAGTGLGLAIAKKVVEDHGGSILLESEPGQGTTVRMRLPVS